MALSGTSDKGLGAPFSWEGAGKAGLKGIPIPRASMPEGTNGPIAVRIP